MVQTEKGIRAEIRALEGDLALLKSATHLDQETVGRAIETQMTLIGRKRAELADLVLARVRGTGGVPPVSAKK